MQNNREETQRLLALARAERQRIARLEDIIGTVIFSILGACVIFTIALWATVKL